jgi:predicted nucleic acid-binding protein
MPITTDFIIYNLADKLNSELSYNQALEFLKVINSSKALKILRTEEETLQEVTKLFQAAKDNKQKLNFTDFIIIQLMRQLEINCLFTFNKWFKEYDIITIP